MDKSILFYSSYSDVYSQVIRKGGVEVKTHLIAEEFINRGYRVGIVCAESQASVPDNLDWTMEVASRKYIKEDDSDYVGSEVIRTCERALSKYRYLYLLGDSDAAMRSYTKREWINKVEATEVSICIANENLNHTLANLWRWSKARTSRDDHVLITQDNPTYARAMADKYQITVYAIYPGAKRAVQANPNNCELSFFTCGRITYNKGTHLLRRIMDFGYRVDVYGEGDHRIIKSLGDSYKGVNTDYLYNRPMSYLAQLTPSRAKYEGSYLQSADGIVNGYPAVFNIHLNPAVRDYILAPRSGLSDYGVVIDYENINKEDFDEVVQYLMRLRINRVPDAPHLDERQIGRYVDLLEGRYDESLNSPYHHNNASTRC